MKRIVVLVSGEGSNLQALIDACQQGRINAEISAVFSNKIAAYGLERARLADIPAHALDVKAYEDRIAFDVALADAIEIFKPSLVVLAGYMRILSAEFVQRFAGRMINIHPSLLPRYPGLHTHARALEAGDAEHGSSVHVVTADLDAGPLLAQARIPVLSGDTPDTLAERVLMQEHRLLPACVRSIASGRLSLEGALPRFDGTPLSAPLHLHDTTGELMR